MAQQYRQLSLLDRQRIQEGLDGGESFREIARSICRSASTVSREVKENRIVKAYKARKAACRNGNHQIRFGKFIKDKQSFLEYLAKLTVVFLARSFLLRLARVAVEKPECTFIFEVLSKDGAKSVFICELRAVVGEYDLEEIQEDILIRYRFEST